MPEKESMTQKGDGKVRRRVAVRGRVQGVGFRYSTRMVARRLGLRGWVRNVADGSVELVAEGPAEDVNALIAWCREGPPAARVRSVDVEDEPNEGDLDPFGVQL